jgi:hypothetical protein
MDGGSTRHLGKRGKSYIAQLPGLLEEIVVRRSYLDVTIAETNNSLEPWTACREEACARKLNAIDNLIGKCVGISLVFHPNKAIFQPKLQNKCIHFSPDLLLAES